MAETRGPGCRAILGVTLPVLPNIGVTARIFLFHPHYSCAIMDHGLTAIAKVLLGKEYRISVPTPAGDDLAASGSGKFEGSGLPSHRLSRLAALAGTDEGFYVLALHSFVEAYVMERSPSARFESLPFGELVEELGNTLKAQRRIDEDTRCAFVRIAKEHRLTHDVRHALRELDREIATAATHNSAARRTSPAQGA